MAAHLVCLTNEGGVPLFSRSSGSAKPLAFAEQGMLYGVQMFAQNHGVTLQTTDTEESKVVWRVFHDSIVLVLVQGDDGSSHVHANTLLEHVFQTMVMYLGLDTISRLRNIERLRRDLRVCYPVIDSLLEDVHVFDSICETVEVVSTTEVASLQEPLESFVMECDSTFGCVHCNGRLLVATPKWWSLSGQEMMLLCRFIRSLPKNSASDIPVYLPHASPKVPHRLISVHLLSGLVVSVLCLDVPTLSTVQSKLIETHWLPHFETLKGCLRASVTNIPKTIPIDPGILGFLVINTEQHKCISSCELPIVEGSMAERRPLTVQKRRRILTSFYRNTVGSIFSVIHSPERKDPSGDRPSTFLHVAEETYMNALDHKCFAINSKDFRLFAIFSSAVPHHAVRYVSLQFLENLKKDKAFTDLREKKS
ncbi:protein fuzzy homolog [Apostichopus japonicus]|uniref:protein fuzzy homolog n=1 Tax=Stichopus japonicus TaxID=307972 RepID=UPI003AB8D709